MLIGAIADDLTGATDLALTLVREGMRTVQVVGVPAPVMAFDGADAVVVALRSRTMAAPEAVRLSLAAADILLARGARQLFFKYCSTFDSTADGNIGPVADALLDRVGERLALACPAFPTNRRTVYRGHLFVGDQLLSDSPMKDHPLTPMRDSSLVRVLQQQTARRVGLVSLDVVARGADAVRYAFERAVADGFGFVVVDAVSDADLHAIGRAAAGMKLVTGGSGVAIGLPQNFRAAGLLQRRSGVAILEPPPGRAVMLAGSCSEATLRQVESARRKGTPTLGVDAVLVADGSVTAETVAGWVLSQPADAIPLVYSSADAATVAAVQARLGRERAGGLIEQLLAETARRLRDRGVSRFLVAGGETSGAVVAALGVTSLVIGPEIDPGVPWTMGQGEGGRLALALKSGNFGADDFFTRAWTMLK